MTIFRLYTQNGDCAGFWVQHRRWKNTCALVLSVCGLRAGELPVSESYQHKTKIMLECYDVRSGRPIMAEAWLDQVHDREFERIAEPFWCHGRLSTFHLARH